MTRTGAMRELYAYTVEARPSRFHDPVLYAEWAARADAWAASGKGDEA